MRKIIGIAILAAIAIGIIAAMVHSIGWEGATVVLVFSALFCAAIFLAVYLICGGADG